MLQRLKTWLQGMKNGIFIHWCDLDPGFSGFLPSLEIPCSVIKVLPFVAGDHDLTNNRNVYFPTDATDNFGHAMLFYFTLSSQTATILEIFAPDFEKGTKTKKCQTIIR